MSLIWRLCTIAMCLLLLPGCVQLTLAWADLKPKDRPASPDIFAGKPVTADDWRETFVPEYRAALARHVYGALPDASETTVISRTTLNANAFNGSGILEEIVFDASATFNGKTVPIRKSFGKGAYLNVILPKHATGPVPIIIMETFCQRWSAVPDPAVTRPRGTEDPMGGVGLDLTTYIFGRFICVPPYETILNAGYGIAVLSPQSIVPDNGAAGLAELRRLSAGSDDPDSRWGAIAAWGWAYSRVVDILEADNRIDPDGIIVWGHSRYGKAALVAAAYDARIDGVISHQSGTGGASLNREKPGESIASITESYPHWFAPRYADYADGTDDLPIDQHMLLALIAPRPILLGNARRDVWSDPNGAFRAAMGADPVYKRLGARGLTVTRLNRFDPTAELSFWIRPGTHGVVEEDWPAFLEFLDAHFKPARDES